MKPLNIKSEINILLTIDTDITTEIICIYRRKKTPITSKFIYCISVIKEGFLIMLDNKKKVVSGIVALSGTFVTPESTQATLNHSNLNVLVKNTKKAAATQQASDALNKVKATKKVLDFVKRDAQKSINKATNIRNNALKKAKQAEEIAEAAKEDWSIKLVIAVKKLKELESQPEKTYLLEQVLKAKEDAEKAKEKFEEKKSEVAKKRLELEQYEESLAAIVEMQDNKVKSAQMGCRIAQIDQQKLISYAS
ncbi:MAG: hypothetical protein AAF349_02650 [Cyanobacteria bacterium P01_A01_bin.68]